MLFFRPYDNKFGADPAITSGVTALFVFLVPWWQSQESDRAKINFP
jgi:hypothetical protein